MEISDSHFCDKMSSWPCSLRWHVLRELKAIASLKSWLATDHHCRLRVPSIWRSRWFDAIPNWGDVRDHCRFVVRENPTHARLFPRHHNFARPRWGSMCISNCLTHTSPEVLRNLFIRICLTFPMRTTSKLSRLSDALVCTHVDTCQGMKSWSV